MAKKHYSDIKTHRIYALVLQKDEPCCYVGKTTSPRLSAVYHRHCRGEVITTKEVLGGENPDLYLLEEIDATGAQAFKRMLAWIAVFAANSYVILNRLRSITQAETPLSVTRQYIDELQAEPLDYLLAATYVEYPTEQDGKPTPQHSPEPRPSPKDQTLSVRLTQEQKGNFIDYCRRTGLSQSQAFSLLLDKAAEDAENLREMLDEKNRHIRNLEDELANHDEKLIRKEVAARVGTYKDMVRTGIRQYLQQVFPREQHNGCPLKPLSTHQYRLQQDPTIDYAYPDSDGFTVIRLDALYWGKSRPAPLFVLGQTEQGQHIKLRYYTDTGLIGYPLRDNPYAYKDAAWYVGYRRAKDGAMDLIMAMPMDRPPVDPPTEMIETLSDDPSSRSLSLDERIAEIQNRRQP